MIQHIFKSKSHDLIGLFANVDTLSKFMTSLQRQALLDPNRYDTYKYLGDGFEFFIEIFLHLHACDNRVGVYDYQPNQVNDNGVDGIGKNIKGDKCVVQIKYRSNVRRMLTANEDHLSNLFSDGMLAHNVVSDNENPKNFRHFVFTTSKGLNFYTDQEMFKKKVKCIGYNEIRRMVDHNLPFWKKVQEAVIDIVNSQTSNTI